MSFIPIRTLVDDTDNNFKTSSFFTNDSHFVKHQKGKLQEINQNEKRYQTSFAYRSKQIVKNKFEY